MAQNPARAAATLLLWLTLLTAVTAMAQPSSPLDARILIDVSGSMKQNDPRNLRQPALRLMVGLMPVGMRAGIWSFAEQVNMQVPLGRVDERWKGQARAEADKIHSRGLYTNIEAALQRATADWKSPGPDAQRHLVLLTDGMVDISKEPADSAASRARIVAELVPRLKALGVRVHTIALSERADHELMRQLSAETGGWYEQVNDAEQLQRVFLRIFEKVGNPDTLPLKDNSFQVDASVQEATLLVFRGREAASPTRLITPGGKEFGAENAPAGIKWHADEGYDLITLSQPEVGAWAVRAAVDPDNRVIVVTDLRMQTSVLPNRLVQGERATFDVRFQDGGQPITRKEFLDVLALTATQSTPQGPGESHALRDDGQNGDTTAGDAVFGARLRTDAATGRHELVITAEGKTFVREKRHSFELIVPARLEIGEIEQDGKTLLSVSLTPDGALLNGQTVAVQSWLEGAGGRADLAMRPDAAGVWRAQLDPTALPGDQQLRLKLTAATALGEPVELDYAPIAIKSKAPAAQPAPPPDEAVEEDEPDAGLDAGTLDLAILAAVNVVLAVLGAGWWFVARRRRQRDLTALLDDEPARPAGGGAGGSGADEPSSSKASPGEALPDVDDLIDRAIDEARMEPPPASEADLDDLIAQGVDEARAGEAAAEAAPPADPFPELGDDAFAGLAEQMAGAESAEPPAPPAELPDSDEDIDALIKAATGASTQPMEDAFGALDDFPGMDASLPGDAAAAPPDRASAS